jgi:ammonium transporter, Amt family
MDNGLDALTTVFVEFYYWVTIPLMFLIHVGFCMYEVGASRRRNHMHTLMKNSMIIPLVTVTFFFFGWWIYFALPNGPFITGGINWEAAGPNALTAPTMAPNLDDRITGVFWAAFLLFSWTAASIVSGAVIERINSGAFWILAVVIGSGAWIVDAAWGWHPEGWMVQVLGYHDAYASGVIHAIAGGFALGILVVLGPRIGKFAADGTPRAINPHNPWMVCVGLFVIYTGFWGFYVACNIPIISPAEIDGVIVGETLTATTIYLTPTTLSAITFNFLMSLSGGMLAAFVVSKGNAFWTYSGGLAGIITASAGNDLYQPMQAMLIGGVGAVIAYRMHYWVERTFRVDDAVGAVAVHGYAGFAGLVIAGFMLWGHPAGVYEGYASINPLGQFIGAVIMFGVLGFLPGFLVAKLLSVLGLLRIPREIELMGLDFGDGVEEEAAAAEVRLAKKALV